ncbi:MAG: bifunctional folylpolyglutamate synthase/dihydrofolate synthase, partial [Flavobacteriaceae bacterium]|nr:bifunctional folylpolyglutamate synthase/dihydrofolate synthase [Flavobacteriaceae bacterium]
NGLLNTVKNTGLKGRWQILQTNPKIICDTAHNKEGLSITMSQLQQEKFSNLHVVFGVVNDKDLSQIWSILPKNATYYFCKPDVLRGLDQNILKAQFLNHGFVGESYLSVNEAIEKAKVNAKSTDVIYIGGSTFVVAEIF